MKRGGGPLGQKLRGSPRRWGPAECRSPPPGCPRFSRRARGTGGSLEPSARECAASSWVCAGRAQRARRTPRPGPTIQSLGLPGRPHPAAPLFRSLHLTLRLGKRVQSLFLRFLHPAAGSLAALRRAPPDVPSPRAPPQIHTRAHPAERPRRPLLRCREPPLPRSRSPDA